MDKVLSAIKSLLQECASSIQVLNAVKEGTEVLHSGHDSASGSGSVINEEIEETDASKNAEDPIQDNRSESDEEDRDPPVHTDNISEGKRNLVLCDNADRNRPSPFFVLLSYHHKSFCQNRQINV